jgi:1-phosphofructokinase/tagatose 6-phosphate kinase
MNVALDRTVAVPRFRLGNRHRVMESSRAPGGKGVNVARALKALGEPVVATGLAGGPTGSRIRELLLEEEVLHDFVEVAGDSRTNYSVVDPTTGEQTEVNQRGPEVTPEEIERFTERLLYLARGCTHCVLAGSLPPGAPVDTYARLMSELRGIGVPVILDSEGEPMRAGLRAQPAIVAPNVTEAEEAVGYEFSDAGDLAEGLRGLVEMGAEEAYVTTGHGCMAIAGPAPAGAPRRHYEANIDKLDPVAGAGSGDAFLAGLVSAKRAQLGIEESLRFAVACGAESTQHLGAGALDVGEVARLVDKVSVRALSSPLGVG